MLHWTQLDYIGHRAIFPINHRRKQCMLIYKQVISLFVLGNITLIQINLRAISLTKLLSIRVSQKILSFFSFATVILLFSLYFIMYYIIVQNEKSDKV